MIERSYIRLVWRNNRGFALFSMAFVTLMQFLILYLVTTIDTGAIIAAILEQLPDAVRAFLQDSFFSMLSYDGAAAFGFNHPLVLALLVITAVNIPVHHITRELDSGTLEMLLAHPLKRSTLLFSLWLAGCLIILVVILSALAGSVTAILLFHDLSAGIFLRLLQIGLNLWLLVSLILSYTLLIAVFARQGFKAGNLSAVITLLFYLAYFLTQLWKDLDFLKPFNIFNYYEPQNLMFGKGNLLLDVLVLGGLIFLCFRISLRRFEKRDIP